MEKDNLWCDECEKSCIWKEFGLSFLEMSKKLYSTDSRVRECHSPCGRVKDVGVEL